MKLRDMMAEFADRMVWAGHNTSWATGEWNNGDDKAGQKYFLYFVSDSAMAEKAEELLKKAGLLCDTPLGRWP